MIYTAIILAEILVVEFLSFWFFSVKKHKFIWCLLTFAVLTAGVYTFLFLAAPKIEGFGNGSGLLMSLGVIYFIPALLNYGGSIKRRFIIAFYSFSYGLVCFCLASRITYCFMTADNKNFLLILLIIQSVLYAISYPIFYYFSKDRVIKYLDLSPKSIVNLFLQYTFASLVLLLSINIAMTRTSVPIAKLIIYIMLIYLIILTYKLSVSYSRERALKNKLSEEIGKDSLTQLENRYSFEKKVDIWLTDEPHFYLFYIDLDKFKSINDDYGHSVGDCYLKNFASTLNALANSDTYFYRLAGDEFVCLTKDFKINEILKQLQVEPMDGIKFLGFSFGYATCPADALDMESLIKLADQNMYDEKNKKNIKKKGSE